MFRQLVAADSMAATGTARHRGPLFFGSDRREDVGDHDAWSCFGLETTAGPTGATDAVVRHP